MAPRLRTLSIDDIKMSEKSLIEIGYNCPLLEELALSRCIMRYSIESEHAENGLKSIFISCSQLKYLDVSGNDFLLGACFEHLPSQLLYLNLGHSDSREALFYLSEKAKNLETLILESCIEDNINEWLKKLTKLRCLSFQYAEFTEPSRPLDLSYLTELEVVNIKLDDVLTFNTLESLQNCPKLKALEVWNDYKTYWDFNEYIQVFKNLKSLKYLSLHDFENLDGLVDFVNSSQLKVSFFEINIFTLLQLVFRLYQLILFFMNFRRIL